MNADEIRRVYLDFMVEQGHVVIPRAPLVPKDDPTTLFTGSGMQPLLPYLLGARHPAGHPADRQPDLPAGAGHRGRRRQPAYDLFRDARQLEPGRLLQGPPAAPVLDLHHRTGRLDPNRIYVSCFIGDPANGIPKDTEAADIWTELFASAGVSTDRAEVDTEENAAAVGTGGARIAFYGKKNWWCRGGKAEEMPIGEPGGPDSEVFYLYPDIEHDPAYGAHCHQNCDCGRFIELGNSVFMQYRRTATGFEQLPRKNVDYGGGLARIAAASMDTPDIFRIDLLWPIVAKLQELSARRMRTRPRRCG